MRLAVRRLPTVTQRGQIPSIQTGVMLQMLRPFHGATRTAVTAISRQSRIILGQSPVGTPLRPLLSPGTASSNQLRHYADHVTIKVPTMAESISEGTLKQWLKEVGDQVEQDEEIATIETDKIDVAVNAPQSGVLTELLAEAESTVTVGQDLAKLEVGAQKESKPKPASPETKSEQSPETKSEPPSETKPDPKSETEPEPSNKSSATETKDQSSPAPKTPKPEQSNTSHKTQPASVPTSKDSGRPFGGIGSREEQRVKMSRMRLRIAERLKQSQNTAASLTTFNEVDMSSLMEMRSLYKDAIFEKTGVKLGFMSAFTRAAILAMRDVPAVNASIEGPNGGDTIVFRDYVDVSVAVATEKGLVTPVVRNAESLSVVEIDKVIADLGRKARENKITLEDMAGGTFTISNGGVFGSLMGTPIINLPQTAVLGLHAVKQRPVAINGKVEIRPMMYLALTYDHRLLDGREAVTFLIKIKEYIEDPRRMLLE